MGDAHPDIISKHVKAYIRVFAALAILTIVTVAASRVHFPGGKRGTFYFLILATGQFAEGVFVYGQQSPRNDRGERQPGRVLVYPVM